MTERITIRRAASADAQAISELCKRVYPQVYRPLPPDEELQVMLEREYGVGAVTQDIEDANKDEWLAIREVTQQAQAGEIVVSSAEVIGLLLLTKGTEAGHSCLKSPEVRGELMLEVERIYIDFAYHGKGVGKLLMSHAERIAREHNLRLLWLCTWKGNDRAVKFYESLGYVIVGEEAWDPGGGWVMTKKIFDGVTGLMVSLNPSGR